MKKNIKNKKNIKKIKTWYLYLPELTQNSKLTNYLCPYHTEWRLTDEIEYPVITYQYKEEKRSK